MSRNLNKLKQHWRRTNQNSSRTTRDTDEIRQETTTWILVAEHGSTCCWIVGYAVLSMWFSFLFFSFILVNKWWKVFMLLCLFIRMFVQDCVSQCWGLAAGGAAGNQSFHFPCCCQLFHCLQLKLVLARTFASGGSCVPVLHFSHGGGAVEQHSAFSSFSSIVSTTYNSV